METDALHLPPRTVHPQPGHGRNKPMYLQHICTEVARNCGKSPVQTAALTTANTCCFFGLDAAAT